MPLLVPHITILKTKRFRGFADTFHLLISPPSHKTPLTVETSIVKTGFSLSNISNHVYHLADCSLRVTQSQGLFPCYQLNYPNVTGLLKFAEKIPHNTANDIYKYTYTKDDSPFSGKGAKNE